MRSRSPGASRRARPVALGAPNRSADTATGRDGAVRLLTSCILSLVCPLCALEHDPEKWTPVFGQDHVDKKESETKTRREVISLYTCATSISRLSQASTRAVCPGYSTVVEVCSSMIAGPATTLPGARWRRR